MPTTRFMPIDTRFPSYDNDGETTINGGNPSNYIYPGSMTSTHHVDVSPFLTGRNYSGTSGSFDDDLNESQDNNTDHNLNGAFTVFDPNNGQYTTHSKVNRYNDLEGRKNKMCQLLANSCSSPIVIAILTELSFVPHPIDGH